MCGIVGFLGKGSKETLKKMADSLKHRGPDSSGFFYDEKNEAGLAHTRLSIIDVSGGSQPIFSEDGSKAIIFNGEIYNFCGLKKELKSRHKFKTNSDTEVILHLYEDLGEKCLEKLEGMFSFAVWDAKEKTLFLARDRFGEKPLYYFFYGGSFVFSSEIKALLCHHAVKKELDFLSLAKFLTYEYVPSPNTIFKNIFKLEPGNFLRFKSGELLIKKQYWDIDLYENSNISFKEAKEKLEEKINRAVSERLISEVPLGVFLSGGIDSSTIAYFASKNSAKKIKTFSIGFRDKSFDESKFGNRVSEFLGTEHYLKIFGEKELLENLPRISSFLDEPFADPSILPTYLLSKFAREYVTVALGGDGGDELFLGYPMFQADKAVYLYSKIPRLARRKIIEPFINSLPDKTHNLPLTFLMKSFVRGVDCPRGLRHQIWISGYHPKEHYDILSETAKEEVYKSAVPIFDWCGMNFFETKDLYNKNKSVRRSSKINYLYLKQYLADDILVKMDRAAMAASLETRSPFLDSALAQFIFSLPYNFKVRGIKTKYILKKLMEDKLPYDIVWRKKKGFGIPVAYWLKNDLKNFMLETLNPRKLKKEGIFNSEKVGILINEHLKGRRDNRKKLWPLICFEMWKEKWL